MKFKETRTYGTEYEITTWVKQSQYNSQPVLASFVSLSLSLSLSHTLTDRFDLSRNKKEVAYISVKNVLRSHHSFIRIQQSFRR